MEDTMDERINDMSINNKEGLTRDSIAAIICLEDEISDANAAIALIKKGKIIAVYRGNRNRPYEFNEFVLMSESEFEKEKNK